MVQIDDGTFRTTVRPRAPRPRLRRSGFPTGTFREYQEGHPMTDDGGPLVCDGCNKHIGSRQIRYIEHQSGQRHIFCGDCAADARAGRIGPSAPDPGTTETADASDDSDDSLPSGELL